jgi:hypothetical protein
LKANEIEELLMLRKENKELRIKKNIKKYQYSIPRRLLLKETKIITVDQLNLYRRTKVILEQSRNSLAYQEQRKSLCKEAANVNEYGFQRLMVIYRQ